MELNDGGVMIISQAILHLAIQDYNRLKKKPGTEEWAEIEEFFKSNWFEVIGQVFGDEMTEQIRRRLERGASIKHRK